MARAGRRPWLATCGLIKWDLKGHGDDKSASRGTAYTAPRCCQPPGARIPPAVSPPVPASPRALQILQTAPGGWILVPMPQPCRGPATQIDRDLPTPRNDCARCWVEQNQCSTTTQPRASLLCQSLPARPCPEPPSSCPPSIGKQQYRAYATQLDNSDSDWQRAAAR
ncbi:hypothetical protein DR999_PMT05973 [Platysternon megacephalum]|uniref:Uncharacterized protein n=1 Tax=Platysternon megacephalum TaxID=55544 RepID=A0A4D9ENG2_9SAUR|nr:hypothetical protein DR999_PMT05973 [Platysternon megacephalum]